MRDLKGKAIVITGAASGIGEALAQGLAQRGARLLLADIDAVGLSRVVAATRYHGCECYGLPTDAGDENAIHALAAEAVLRFGAADVLINNAGVALVCPVEKLQTADAHWLMNINFWGVVHGCRAFLPQMQTRPEAMLVNVSSIFAMVSMPTQSIYNASKAAVRGFSDALREELRATPVRVLCVHPGGISTNIVNKARVTDVSLVADSEKSMRAQFDAAARTTAQQAAQAIIAAIQANRTRLLIGADAKVLDALYRLVPTRVSAWMSALGKYGRRRSGSQQIISNNNGNRMNNFLKANCLALYALALASLVWAMPWGLSPLLQKVALIILAIHVVEAVVAFKYIKSYKGPLVTSLGLALLFGVLHWLPLARAARLEKTR